MRGEVEQIFINGQLFRRAWPKYKGGEADHLLVIWYAKNSYKCYLVVDVEALRLIEKRTGSAPHEISVFQWRGSINCLAYHDCMIRPAAKSKQSVSDCTYKDIVETSFKDDLPTKGMVYVLAAELN